MLQPPMFLGQSFGDYAKQFKAWTQCSNQFANYTEKCSSKSEWIYYMLYILYIIHITIVT